MAKLLVPRLLRWFAAHARDLPWRRTRDPYAVWVSEVMLQQTQVATVVPYFERWMSALPNVASLAAASEERVLKLWEGLGYYHRARNLQRAARQIVSEHGGRFPVAFDAVLALPGVGRYTAGAICSIAFNQPAPILDGNVTRVLARLFALRGDPRARRTQATLWSLAGVLVRSAAERNLTATPLACSAMNQSLMELGATVCAPRSPDCPRCPVRDQCAALRLGIVAKLPALPPRARTTARRCVAFVVTSGGRVLVRQRPEGVVNAGLWEFPGSELAPGAKVDAAALLRGLLGSRPRSVAALCTVRHAITRYRFTVEALHAEAAGRPSRAAGRWVSRARLEALPLTGAHARIRRAFLPAAVRD